MATVAETLAETINNSDTTANTLLLNIIDSIEMSDGILKSLFISLLDSITISDELAISLTIEIVESFDPSDNISGPRTTTDSLDDSLLVLDNIFIGFLYQILESINLSDVNDDVARTIVVIKDKILTIDNTSSLIVIVDTILDIIALTDTLKHGLDKTILDTILVTDILNNTIKSINSIISTILCSDSNNDITSVFLLTSDIIYSSDLLDTNTLFNNLINDDLIIILGDLEGGDKYISYLLSPETFSVTTYSNYNFYDSTRFLNHYLFINKEGLFKYGGETDNNEIITAKIQTAALSFGTSNLKQLPALYMGLSNSNKLVLKVSVDGRADVLYKLNKKTNGLQTQKIAIGKGLIGRYFQFELITQDNTQFELESLEFYPLTLKRKL